MTIKNDTTPGASAIILSKGDLDHFKASLLDEVKSLSADKLPGKKWLRSKEVLELLHISSGTLQNLRTKGILPYSKLGGTLFYDEDDILRMLKARKKGL